MKNLIFGLAFLFPVSVFSQSRTLEIENLIVEKNGEKQEVQVSQTHDVSIADRKPIIVYEDQGIRIAFEVKYQIRGDRVKLSRQVYAIAPGGEEVKGPRRKDVIYLKTGNQDAMKKKVSENLLIDKVNLTTYFISFDYSFIYRN
jgi:hypothetical protein